MSIWTAVRQEVTDGVEGLRKGLTEILDVTEDLTRKGKIKLEIQSCRNALRERLADLGGRVYHLAVEEESGAALEDSEVKDLFTKIDDLKSQVEAYEAELAQMGGSDGEASKASVPVPTSRDSGPANAGDTL